MPAAKRCGIRLCGIPQRQDICLAWREQLEYALRQGDRLQHDKDHAGGNQRQNPSRSPDGMRADTLADGPSHAGDHGQRYQDQLSQGMAPAHHKGKKEDDSGQTAVDNIQQKRA